LAAGTGGGVVTPVRRTPEVPLGLQPDREEGARPERAGTPVAAFIPRLPRWLPIARGPAAASTASGAGVEYAWDPSAACANETAEGASCRTGARHLLATVSGQGEPAAGAEQAATLVVGAVPFQNFPPRSAPTGLLRPLPACRHSAERCGPPRCVPLGSRRDRDSAAERVLHSGCHALQGKCKHAGEPLAWEGARTGARPGGRGVRADAAARPADASDAQSELCQPCKGRCGRLARTWALEQPLAGLAAGAVLHVGAFSLCERHTRAPRGVCVPGLVRPAGARTVLTTRAVLSSVAASCSLASTLWDVGRPRAFRPCSPSTAAPLWPNLARADVHRGCWCAGAKAL